MSEPFYIYNADVYCEACGESIKEHLKRMGRRPVGYKDEGRYDSNTYPQGPYTDEASDGPQHCGSGEDCLDPYVWSDGRKSGKFLENNLTNDGVEWLRDAHRHHRSELTQHWMDHYGSIYHDLEIDDVDEPDEGEVDV